ncbi:hypothetical protein ACFPIJ_38665 [Dactylosporangium cerinum]|uniref:Uncharacterized protein n=1 Tax=Dactylosporangium cerinum TaxID=1434730 RepID=A0ABV9W6U0_9ACTN
MVNWIAKVGCEGGPLLVCAASAFADWGGAVLDEDYELDPACDLHRANEVLYPADDELEAGFVHFAAHTGLVWEMDGPGVAEIASTHGGLLIMRSWVRNTDAPHRYVTGPAAADVEQPVGELDLTGGGLAVVWAPVVAAEVGPFPTAPPAPVTLDLDHIHGVGVLLPVRPGRYQVSRGSLTGTRGQYAPLEEQHGPPVAGNDDDWSCRWLRLRPVGAPA